MKLRNARRRQWARYLARGAAYEARHGVFSEEGMHTGFKGGGSGGIRYFKPRPLKPSRPPKDGRPVHD